MKAIALHEKIRRDVESNIMAGKLTPGQRLPTEMELMRLYGCSRMTVNKAFSALAMLGLVERKKRSGTIVAQPRIHAMVLDIPDLEMEVNRRGQTYGYESIHRRIRTARQTNEAERELVGRGRLIQLRCIHSAAGHPIAVEDRLINLSAVAAAATANFSVESPGSWLLKHVPWSEAETRISALAADEDIASLLAARKGSPCLVIERKTWRGKQQITNVRQVFLGSAFDLYARFNAPSTDAAYRRSSRARVAR